MSQTRVATRYFINIFLINDKISSKLSTESKLIFSTFREKTNLRCPATPTFSGMSDDEDYSNSESSEDEAPVEQRVRAANARPARRERNLGPLSYYWCFTSFLGQIDVPYEQKTEQLRDDCTYFVCQREIAPDSGREHFQGYVEFSVKKRRTQVQRLIGDERAHCELRRGSAKQASDYCKKIASRVPQTEPIEYGDLSKPAVNQFELLTRAIQVDGATYQDIARDYPSAILRYNSGIRALISARDAERKVEYTPVVVKLLIGPTGCGKTRLAYDRAARVYQGKAFTKVFSGGSGDWWDGYADHKLIIIDDFNGGTAIETLLTLLGGYGGNKLWAVKGGFIRLSHQEVIITSNKKADDWYPFATPEHKAALNRRITTVYDFFQGNINSID